MAHQVLWTEVIIQEFVKLACLSEIEEKIIRLRAKGYSISYQSIELGLSESAINAITKRLKIKYDAAQKLSDKLPQRKFTSKATYSGEE